MQISTNLNFEPKQLYLLRIIVNENFSLIIDKYYNNNIYYLRQISILHTLRNDSHEN